MTDIAEGVAVLIDLMEQDEKKKCEYKPKKNEWKCNLAGDGGRLATNITKHCGIPKPAVPTSLAGVTTDVWPSQAHHLIPWQQLEKHPVAQWLSSDKGKLRDHNSYDVDHGNNGKFMPYASALTDWAGATKTKKRKIVEAVMSEAGIQLHQGPHSYKPYGVGEEGYKTRVGEDLVEINGNSMDHYSAQPPCKDCKDKEEAKKKAPRRNVVRFMDKASTLLEGDINAGKIYVSRRAAEFVEAGGVLGGDA